MFAQTGQSLSVPEVSQQTVGGFPLGLHPEKPDFSMPFESQKENDSHANPAEVQVGAEGGGGGNLQHIPLEQVAVILVPPSDPHTVEATQLPAFEAQDGSGVGVGVDVEVGVDAPKLQQTGADIVQPVALENLPTPSAVHIALVVQVPPKDWQVAAQEIFCFGETVKNISSESIKEVKIMKIFFTILS